MSILRIAIMTQNKRIDILRTDSEFIENIQIVAKTIKVAIATFIAGKL